MKYYLVMLIIFLCLGCDDLKEEVDDRPFGRTQLVLINGFLSPEEPLISIRVSKTVSVFDTTLDLTSNDLLNTLVIKDAVVIIIDENQNEIVLPFVVERGTYEIEATQFPIIPGQKYNLKITAEGKEFTAQSSIPRTIVDDVTTNIGVILDESVLLRSLSIEFDDIMEENNFYVIGATFIDPNDTASIETSFNFGSKQFATDVNGDGIPITANGHIFNTNQNLEVTVKIANAEELIYETLRASFINETQAGGVFFEPLIPPNNIQGDGGYGVFGGFRLFEKKIRL